MLEIIWPATLSGRPSLSDHYSLYGALCRRNLILHAEPTLQIRLERDYLLVRSHPVRVAAMAAEMPEKLGIGNNRLQIGKPEIRRLRASPVLESPIVTIKNATEPRLLGLACREQLERQGIKGVVQVGGRKVISIKGNIIVGYAVRVSELSPTESITLLERGLGGRIRMGCGVFES